MRNEHPACVSHFESCASCYVLFQFILHMELRHCAVTPSAGVIVAAAATSAAVGATPSNHAPTAQNVGPYDGPLINGWWYQVHTTELSSDNLSRGLRKTHRDWERSNLTRLFARLETRPCEQTNYTLAWLSECDYLIMTLGMFHLNFKLSINDTGCMRRCNRCNQLSASYSKRASQSTRSDCL